jgi:hypothetical protein
MEELLNRLAILFIRHYPPIGNIAHKYRTKVTAIGLLKQINLSGNDYYMPYYERLMSYKLLVKDLLDNIRISRENAIKILAALVKNIATTQAIPQLEQFAESDLYGLMLLVNPRLLSAGLEQVYQLCPKFSDLLKDEKNYTKIGQSLLQNYLQTNEQYNTLIQTIIKLCLTRTQQEEVLKRLNAAVYNFFVYYLYDKRQMNYKYEIYVRQNHSLVTHEEPLVNTKVLARFIINRVGGYVTTVNFFGPRISNFDEIKELFKKQQNILIMFF